MLEVLKYFRFFKSCLCNFNAKMRKVFAATLRLFLEQKKKKRLERPLPLLQLIKGAKSITLFAAWQVSTAVKLGEVR